MADDTDAPETGAEDDFDTEAETAPTDGGDIEGLQKALAKANAEAKKYRLQTKELKPLAEKAKELEEAGKTELERLTGELASAKEQATRHEMAAMRLEVAIDKAPDGMSMAQVRKLSRRLSGSTQEELESDAEELFAEFAPKSSPASNGQRPTENLRRVPVGDASNPARTDMNDWMRGRSKSGSTT